MMDGWMDLQYTSQRMCDEKDTRESSPPLLLLLHNKDRRSRVPILQLVRPLRTSRSGK